MGMLGGRKTEKTTEKIQNEMGAHKSEDACTRAWAKAKSILVGVREG